MLISKTSASFRNSDDDLGSCAGRHGTTFGPFLTETTPWGGPYEPRSPVHPVKIAVCIGIGWKTKDMQ